MVEVPRPTISLDSDLREYRTGGRRGEGKIFVAHTDDEFWPGFMSGEVFEASEELAAEFGFDPNDVENVVSTEEFHAPRNVLAEGEW